MVGIDWEYVIHEYDFPKVNSIMENKSSFMGFQLKKYGIEDIHLIDIHERFKFRINK